VPGANYYVESAADLPSAVWNVIPASATNAVADTVTLVVPWAPGAPARFYRSVSP